MNTNVGHSFTMCATINPNFCVDYIVQDYDVLMEKLQLKKFIIYFYFFTGDIRYPK